MRVETQSGANVNYEPNSLNGPVEDKSFAIKPFKVSGLVQRNKFAVDDIDFEQPRAFWVKVFKEENKAHLVENMVNGMKTCR